MAFAVDARIRVADGSSAYRWKKGTVISVDGDQHQVRLDGHGCNGRTEFLTGQLKSDGTPEVLNYGQCSG